jgi:hypothetical protein
MTAPMLAPLPHTGDGTRSRVELEQVIARGLDTFLEVGTALLEIQERKLYRTTHPTFAVYLKDRWPRISRPRAYQLIGAARVVSTVVDNGLPAPRSERVARELTPVLAQPETLAAVWGQVIEQHGPDPTATEVQSIVGSITWREVDLSPEEWEDETPPAWKKIDDILGSISLDIDDLAKSEWVAPPDARHMKEWTTTLHSAQKAIAKALHALEGKENPDA